MGVPENRADPASRTIEIAFAMTTPANASPDPVLLLPGGPGGAPLPRFVERLREWVPADRTTIVFDPRGTGFSGGPLCPELGVTYSEIAGMDLSRLEARAVQDGAQRACRNRLLREGVDLGSYNSATVAQDLIDLRRALGIEKWNLVSVSYGVPFARETMRRDPDGVRSSVLALGPSPDLSQLLSRDIPFFRRALRRVVDGCAQARECADQLPDLEAMFVQTVDGLRDAPITLDVEPAEFRLPRFTVNAQDFAQAIYFMLASESDVASLPSIIRGFAERDADIVRGVVEDTWGGLDSSFSSGMALSVMCYDAATPTSEAEWQEGGEGLPDAYAEIEFYLSHCGFWDDARASAAVRGPARLDTPTLVISGEFDPMNPPQVGDEHLATLPNGFHVVIPGLGHMPNGRSRGCWAELMRVFLQDPSSRPDSSCAEALEPVVITPDPPAWLRDRGQ
jgi:pimeloyl-ACP methyl ester carboxylesterase